MPMVVRRGGSVCQLVAREAVTCGHALSNYPSFFIFLDFGEAFETLSDHDDDDRERSVEYGEAEDGPVDLRVDIDFARERIDVFF